MAAHSIAYGGIAGAVATGGVAAAAIDLTGIAAIIGQVGIIILGLAATLAPLIVSLIVLKRTTVLTQTQKDLATAQLALVVAQQAMDQKVVKVGEAVDGKMEALKGLIEKSAHLAGKAEGIAEERADPQTHAVTTIKDDNAAPVPAEASKRPGATP